MKHSKFYYLTHPSVTIPILLAKVSQRHAIELQWKNYMDYPLDLENPKTFCEKLNWLKLHDHNPLYHKLVDKYEVKNYVAKIIGDQYVVKTYGIWDNVDEIEFDKLPQKFVLKCTHNSMYPVICYDKSTLYYEEAKRAIRESIKAKNYYKKFNEWVYKSVKPRIIAEELLEDDTFEDLVNYKFWCFNGEPKIMYITVKTDDIWENFYDMDFNPLDITHGFRRYECKVDKPKTFEKMKEIAGKLSAGIPHVRIDLYEIKGKIYFSEYTFYDWAGLKPIMPYEWDVKIGEWLKLEDIK